MDSRIRYSQILNSINILLEYGQDLNTFDNKPLIMEALYSSWLFAAFIGVMVILLVVIAIKEILKRRGKPVNPQDKATGKSLIVDLFRFMFGRWKSKDIWEEEDKG